MFQKSSDKNRPIIITQGPKFLELLYSIMNLNTISLPWQARPTNTFFSFLGRSEVSHFACKVYFKISRYQHHRSGNIMVVTSFIYHKQCGFIGIHGHIIRLSHLYTSHKPHGEWSEGLHCLQHQSFIHSFMTSSADSLQFTRWVLYK